MIEADEIVSVETIQGREFQRRIAVAARAHDFNVCSIDEAGGTALFICKDGHKPMILMVKERGEHTKPADWEWIERWRGCGLMADVVWPRKLPKVLRLLAPTPGVLVGTDGEEVPE